MGVSLGAAFEGGGKKHTASEAADETNVGILNVILSKNGGAAPQLKSNDKWPNTDGNIELHDASGKPFGRVNVQVKPIGDDLTLKLKDLEIYDFIEKNPLLQPFIVIGVDREKEVAYWRHLDVDDPAVRDRTWAIRFDPANKVARDEKGYLAAWAAQNQIYAARQAEGRALEKTSKALVGLASANVDLSAEDMRQVHTFLDTLNGAYDREFAIVKKRFYPNVWKMGFAYKEFNERVVETVYGIPHEANDQLVKRITTNDIDAVLEETGGWAMHNQNPFRSEPEIKALEIVAKRTEAVLKNRILFHPSTDLAAEYVHSTANWMGYALGLDGGHDLTIEQLQASVTHLQAWVQVALETLLKRGYRHATTFAELADRNSSGARLYYNPETLWRGLSDKEREAVAVEAKARIAVGKLPPIGPIGHDKLPLGIFVESVDVLAKAGMKVIADPLPHRGFMAQEVWKWNEAQWTEFAQRSIPLADRARTELLKANFPDLEGKLGEWGWDEDGLLIIVDVDRGISKFPAYYYLKLMPLDGGPPPTVTEIVARSETPFKPGEGQQEMDWKRRKWRLDHYGFSSQDPDAARYSPTLHDAYDDIKRRVIGYLDKRIKKLRPIKSNLS